MGNIVTNKAPSIISCKYTGWGWEGLGEGVTDRDDITIYKVYIYKYLIT